LKAGSVPVFSRRAFAHVGEDSLEIDARPCRVLEDARMLSTRGVGTKPSADDLAQVLSSLPAIDQWMCELLMKVGDE
jgi:hypothetical protein